MSYWEEDSDKRIFFTYGKWLYALDAGSGELTGGLLWKTKLPSPGFATPATYEVDGKQYIVIACGGTPQLGIIAEIVYIAFALPDQN